MATGGGPLITIFGTPYKSLKEGLHAITNGLVVSPKCGQIRNFYDLILGCMHIPDVFDLEQTTTVPISDGIVYCRPTDNLLTLRQVSSNFWGRVMYDACMQNGLQVSPILAMLRLSGIQVHPQLLCCAAATPPCDTESLSNAPGEQLNWCKSLIKSMGHPVYYDNQIITDVNGVSILDVAHIDNIKYILQSLVSCGCTLVYVQHVTHDRIKQVSQRDPKVHALLTKISTVGVTHMKKGQHTHQEGP